MILINFNFCSTDKTSSPREAVDNLELTDRHLSVQTHQEREGKQLLYYSKQRKHTSSKLKLFGVPQNTPDYFASLVLRIATVKAIFHFF